MFRAILIAIAACIVIAAAFAIPLQPGEAKGQEAPVVCVPYDLAVSNVTAGGFTFLTEIPIEGFEADRLVVFLGPDGRAYAAPVVGDCIINVSTPLGLPDQPPAEQPPATTPGAVVSNPADRMRSNRAAMPRAPPSPPFRLRL